MAGKGICRHCRKAPVNRPRKLCWACYYAPGLREMYPSTSKYANRGSGRGDGGDKGPAPEATDAPPGTPEKMAVLEWRARNRFALFHPGDAADMEGATAADFPGVEVGQRAVAEAVRLRNQLRA